MFMTISKLKTLPSIPALMDFSLWFIIWLNILKCNGNPVIAAPYYLETVSPGNVSPKLLQTYCGIENSLTTGIQSFLAYRLDAYRYETSPSESFQLPYKRSKKWYKSL